LGAEVRFAADIRYEEDDLGGRLVGANRPTKETRVSTSQKGCLVILLICACAFAGCVKSKEDAQIELIECAGLHTAIPQSFLEPIYTELRSRGVEPVAIQPIRSLAAGFRNTYTVQGRGAEVNARWDKGVTAGKDLAEKRDAAGIAKYLKGCVASLNAAVAR
jgi:hypothetical protein